jgi:hypothetical protein
MQAGANTQLQIRAVLDSLNRARDRHLLLEHTLADVEHPDPEEAALTAPAADGTFGGNTPAQQAVAAKQALQALQLRLKSDHPDVLRLKRVVADLENKADAEAAEGPVSTPLSPAELQQRKRIGDLRAEIELVDRQIQMDQAEEKRLRDVASNYQKRVELAPTRESELIELTRDYTTLQAQYASLLSKKEESQISANLERRQIGEQFMLLVPARLAEKPFSRNRPRINGLGLAGGLAVGLVLIALFEVRDTSFKTDDDVLIVLGLPVLAVVPLMRSRGERRRVFRLRLLMHLGLGATVATCLAVVVYTFVR